MRKILFIFCLLLFTCDDEPVDVTQITSPPTQLVTITENFNNSSVAVFDINEGLNTQITYSNDSYSMNDFENNLMVLEEIYDASDNLISYTNFAYDLEGRLISVNTFGIEAGVEYLRRKVITSYIGNKIDVSNQNYDSEGNITYNSQETLTLNTEGLIVKSENIDSMRYWEATYDNGNLNFFFIDGYGDTINGSGTFTYSNKLVSEAYQKEKYRFGIKWKTNIMIYAGGNYPFKQLAETGDNYLTGYNFILSSDATEAVSLVVDYEFDNQGNLIKQTKTKQFFEVPNDRVLTYQYE